MKTKLFIFLIVHCTLVIDNCFSQWQPDVRLTNDPAISWTCYNNAWCIAASGDSVHVVWFDLRDGNYEIYYKRSPDGGTTWGADTRLTNNSAVSFLPSISVSGLIVHVVWFDNRDGNNEIYYKRSTDAGVSWGVDTRLTNNSANSLSPSVSVSGSVVHVVWDDNRDGPSGNTEIYYKRSADGGVSWGSDTRLTSNSFVSAIPSVSVSGSVVHVVWDDNRDGLNYEIYYKRSPDGGTTWGADTRLTNNSALSFYPSVSVSGSIVHVVWFDERDGNLEIYYKRSADGGISWGADTRLTNNSAASQYPSGAVSSSAVHVVWEDSRVGNPEIYYKRSINGGVSWGADTRLTNNSAHSANPSVSISGSVVHVVWYDERDGNLEIYYKRDPTGNVVGIKNINSELPREFSLSQNYPNPFNPATKIKFDIPDEKIPLLRGVRGVSVYLKIFDILGREIATLVNEQLNPGKYEVEWDGSNYTSGVYYYRLTAGDYSETKKMALIK